MHLFFLFYMYFRCIPTLYCTLSGQLCHRTVSCTLCLRNQFFFFFELVRCFRTVSVNYYGISKYIIQLNIMNVDFVEFIFVYAKRHLHQLWIISAAICTAHGRRVGPEMRFRFPFPLLRKFFKFRRWNSPGAFWVLFWVTKPNSLLLLYTLFSHLTIL